MIKFLMKKKKMPKKEFKNRSLIWFFLNKKKSKSLHKR